MRVLNPADVFTLMMDTEIRKSGLPGNYCAIMIELEGRPDPDLIRRKCNDFANRFPAATARLNSSARKHFWDDHSARGIPFHSHSPKPDSTVAGTMQTASAILNTRCAAEDSAPVELHLIPENEHSLLILKWFHPACDAKGAELVLHHLFQESTATPETPHSALAERLKKWSWWTRLKLAYKAKKHIQSLDRYPSVLPTSDASSCDEVCYQAIHFTTEESTRIMQLARQHTGLTGTSLYFIGCFMRALEQTGASRSGEAYCVPYASNYRKRKSLYPVFGNEVSFLFAQAERGIVQDRARLFSHLKDQNKAAIKNALDDAMLALMVAGSWLKLEQYGQTVRNTASRRERSSFWFSFTGSMDPEPEQICGHAVRSVFQFSQLTGPPGIGFLVNQFQGRLTLNINFVRNKFDTHWVTMLEQNIRRELLEIDLDSQ